MKVFNLQMIKSAINMAKVIKLQEDGFVLFSQGAANIPMPAHLNIDDPKSSYHIKYGHIHGDHFWVVKIAGGPFNLPICGAMIAINTKNGKPEYFLQDDGYLTSLRTAVAGLIAAKHLANKNIEAIGVIGTGLQARMQVELLYNFTTCKNIFVWGRSKEKLFSYKDYMSKKGFTVKIVDNIATIGENCNLIITATSSYQPLLQSSHIKPGTHITAVGADTHGKIELEPKLIAKCDIIVVDSKDQCIDHGEVALSCQQGLIKKNELIELGQVISNPLLGRINQDQITIADLTGLAVQDIQIVKSIIL